VSEHGDRRSPRPAGSRDGAEAARRRVAQAGRATIRRQNPSSRGRGTKGLCLGAASLHSGHLRGIGPEPGTMTWDFRSADPLRTGEAQDGYFTPQPQAASDWALVALNLSCGRRSSYASDLVSMNQWLKV
jgi:hypothetical protein